MYGLCRAKSIGTLNRTFPVDLHNSLSVLCGTLSILAAHRELQETQSEGGCRHTVQVRLHKTVLYPSVFEGWSY